METGIAIFGPHFPRSLSLFSFGLMYAVADDGPSNLICLLLFLVIVVILDKDDKLVLDGISIGNQIKSWWSRKM